MDYAVTASNDTIYGVIQKQQLHFIKKSNGMLSSINLIDTKSIRKNDVVYLKDITVDKKDNNTITTTFLDVFISQKAKEQDYIVTAKNDTIMGLIKSPLFGLKYIKNDKSKKVKVCKDLSIAYKKNNELFRLKTISKPILSVTKKNFLKVIYSGKVNLYRFKILRNDVGSISPKNYYIIEKNDTLHLISNSNFKQELIDLFIDNTRLVERIDNGFYDLENIYLMVKMYNEREQ